MNSQTRNSLTTGSFVEDLNESIRQNPVAAALVGAGVLWMFFGGGKFLSNAATATTNAVGAAAGSAKNVVGDAIAETASRTVKATHQAGEAIAEKTDTVATLVKDAASAGYEALKSQGEAVSGSVSSGIQNSARSTSDFGRELGASIQTNLSDTLERQPLLLGAIGLALGAGIAAAFPATSVEKEMLGDAGSAVKKKIQEVAAETSERAKNVFAEVKKEAQAQGLTSDALKGVADKVKVAATSSRDSIKGRLL